MGEYLFAVTAYRRSKPSHRFVGFLKTHGLRIRYYPMLNGEDPRSATSGDPLISFPISYLSDVLAVARELGARTWEEGGLPWGILPSEIALRRHVLFSLVASTMRKPDRLNTLRDLMLTRSYYFIDLMFNIAVDRYREGRWSMLRVARAIKALYGLDRK